VGFDLDNDADESIRLLEDLSQIRHPNFTIPRASIDTVTSRMDVVTIGRGK